MSWRNRGISRALAVAGLLATAGPAARGQAPTIDAPNVTSPGSGTSPFGRTPGAGGAATQGAPDSLLGGRAGPTTPKGVPTSISTPGMTMGTSATAHQGVATTPNIPPATIPAAGPLSIPPTEEDAGPADGLTLDQAIDRAIKENLDLRSKFFEIPQAKADILTASLRANPVFYADAQLVPYGQYTRTKPGGQTQYDVNISYPLDLSRKRQARTASAARAEKVTEAQYQDAVRQTIDNVYSGFVDVLQARRTIAFSQAGLVGLLQALATTEELVRRNERKQADVRAIRIQTNLARQQLVESEAAYLKARQALGTLLNLPPDQGGSIEVRGTLKDEGYAPPGLPEMIQIALQNRPDVIAYRLGVERARSDVRLQYANRFSDVYVLYQPYTLQDNTPFGLKSPTSWAIGVTVPLPIYNRNQGNIQRSKLNVSQTQVELASIERQAIQDVHVADREYHTALAGVRRFEREVLPDSTEQLRDAVRLFPSEITQLDYLAALRDYNENARGYLDSQVRLRRAVLTINTALGQRVLP